MNLTKNINTKSKSIVIGEKLIEAGDDAWQIRNLTGISNKEIVVQLDIPEPTFTDPEPKGEIKIGVPIFVLIVGLVAAGFFNSSIAFWVSVAFAVYNLWDGKDGEKKIWNSKKENYEKKHAVWREMKNNPPIVYSLAIETNSGSRPIFYSFDKDGVSRAVTAIKGAMKNPLKEQITYNINAIDMSGDTNINQMGANIYQQNIQEVAV